MALFGPVDDSPAVLPYELNTRFVTDLARATRCRGSYWFQTHTATDTAQPPVAARSYYICIVEIALSDRCLQVACTALLFIRLAATYLPLIPRKFSSVQHTPARYPQYTDHTIRK